MIRLGTGVAPSDIFAEGSKTAPRVRPDKRSVAGRVAAEARALGCGFDGASMGAVGDPVDHRDDVAADEAQVSESRNHIAVRTDRDVVGRLPMVLVRWGSASFTPAKCPVPACLAHPGCPASERPPRLPAQQARALKLSAPGGNVVVAHAVDRGAVLGRAPHFQPLGTYAETRIGRFRRIGAQTA